MVVRKMKDKCKDAARMRREKERAEFVELSRLLPLPSSTTSQLDKASIIRLTSSYLRMRAAFPEGLGENWGQQRQLSGRPELANQPEQALTHQQQQQQQHQPIRELGSLLLQTLDGFVFAMHRDGKIMYISETASVHLGLPQIDLTGSSVFEYIHPADREDVKQILSLTETEQAKLNETHQQQQQHQQPAPTTVELGRSFCMRMKCILPKRNAGLVSAGYKAIHCNGYLKVRCKLASGGANQPEWESCALVAVGHSLLPTASTEFKLGSNSFMFRASLDFKFYYVESILTDLLGLEQTDLIGQSLYQFVHANDIQHLEHSHRLLLDKGQVISKYYRLMRRDGGFVWMQSYSNVLNNPRNTPKPQHIVSICMILGDDPYDQSRFLYDRCETPTKADHEISKSLSFDSCASQEPRCHAERRIQVKQSSSSVAKTNEKYSKRDKLGQMRKMKQPRPAIKCQLAKANMMMIAQSQPSKTTVTKRALLDHAQTILVEPSDDCQHLATLESSSCSRHLMQSSAHNNLVTSSTLETPSASEYCASMRNYAPGFATIGSTRRASDDSCSIVSSLASTSISSISSSAHHAVAAAATPEHYLPATFGVTNDNCSLDQHHLQHRHSFSTSSMASASLQSSGDFAGAGGDSCLVSIDESCRTSKSLPDHCAHMSQQIVGPNNLLVWPRVEALGAYQLDNQEQHFNSTTMNQFVHVNTTSNQPWMNTTIQAHMCSSAPDTPLNLNLEFTSDHQIQHHSNLHHHQANAGDIYMETHQPYDCYTTGHSAAIHFHPSTNIYTV